MCPGFDACQFLCALRGSLRGSRREFFLCNLCALRALCGLTLFGMLILLFLVWPKPRLRKSSRRATKKTVSITDGQLDRLSYLCSSAPARRDLWLTHFPLA